MTAPAGSTPWAMTKSAESARTAQRVVSQLRVAPYAYNHGTAHDAVVEFEIAHVEVASVSSNVARSWRRSARPLTVGMSRRYSSAQVAPSKSHNAP